MTTPPPEPTPAAPRPRLRRARRAQFNIWDALLSILSAGVLMATLFTFWTPANLFSDQLFNEVISAWDDSASQAYPTATPLPAPRIGIVAGHMGNDSGSVCADNLQEADVNRVIAALVQQKLTDAGYQVDLLNEFDERLQGYQALALVSIHNDSCTYVNDDATGFKVAAASASAYPEKAIRLQNCLVDRYSTITGMRYHANTVTNDMTYYHAFEEIHTQTTAAIIETGFLYLDREILTTNPNLVAEGVAAGILCYIRNESAPAQQP
ncbi:MAG TPA: N-acetylmuramoyl-L-alanine amidase [Anaerolineaceae bacterium]|nr:N-acetylmuramoyl-L-alanine amidase [Anaerolineaceae bacterium]HQH86848.1 N-acetylmuramoyl-L-alanine amidase [Anaerolineaceae bacterium]